MQYFSSENSPHWSCSTLIFSLTSIYLILTIFSWSDRMKSIREFWNPTTRLASLDIDTAEGFNSDSSKYFKYWFEELTHIYFEQNHEKGNFISTIYLISMRNETMLLNFFGINRYPFDNLNLKCTGPWRQNFTGYQFLQSIPYVPTILTTVC